MMNKAKTFKLGVVSSTQSVNWRSKLTHVDLNSSLFFGGGSTRQRQRKYIINTHAAQSDSGD